MTEEDEMMGEGATKDVSLNFNKIAVLLTSMLKTTKPSDRLALIVIGFDINGIINSRDLEPILSNFKISNCQEPEF